MQLRPTLLDRRGFLRLSLASAMATGHSSGLVSSIAADDSVPPIAARMAALEAEAPLAMLFRGTSADEARQWQAEFKAKLCELLGPFRPPAQFECELERRVERPTHIREERVLRADDVPPVPFHLLLPRAGENVSADKRPGILALHGHGEFGHDSIVGIDSSPQRKTAITSANYDYGLKLVERGYVVAAPCLTPFGRRLGREPVGRNDACTLVNLQLQHLGKLLIAENLRDSLWALDFLAQHHAVNAERLACVGLSYGGRMTTMAAALDSRIRVAVIAGAMNMFQERAIHGATAGCQVIPGLLNFGDMPEVASLIAPRACIWTVGDTDRLLDPEWAEKFRARQARIYRALGAPDQMQVDRFAGGHQWRGDVAYAVLEQKLML